MTLRSFWSLPMAYPNNPVDPEIVQWGWPWHGRINSADSFSGLIQLPSGQTKGCPQYGGHFTYLWDIDMPEPENEEGADEQWWPVAILRGSGRLRSTASISPLYAYGGVPVGGGPIKLGDQVGRLTILFVVVNEAIKLTVSTSFNGAGIAQNHTKIFDLSFSSLGADYRYEDGSLYSFDALITDRTKDGKKSLIRLSRNIALNQYSSPTEVLAILEISVAGEFSQPVIELNVIDSGESCRGVREYLQLPSDAGLSQVNLPGASGYPGTHYQERVISATCNAWYVGQIPMLVKFECHELLTVTQAISSEPLGDFGYVSDGSLQKNYQAVFKLKFNGIESVAIVSLISSSLYHVQYDPVPSGNSFSTNEHTLNLSVNGQPAREQSTTNNVSSDRIILPLSNDVSPNDYLPAASAVMLVSPSLDGTLYSLVSHSLMSNNAMDIGIYYPSVPSLGTPSVRKYFACISPTGADSAVIDRPSAVEPGFDIASYNPVTGELIRRDNSPLYSWV